MVQAHACMQQSLYTCFHDFGVLRSPEAIYTLNTPSSDPVTQNPSWTASDRMAIFA